MSKRTRLVRRGSALVVLYALVVTTLRAQTTQPAVEIEEPVTQWVSGISAAAPLWCWGAPLLVRVGQEVYVSIAEPGPTREQRWRVWHRGPQGWEVLYQADAFEEPEPCPLVGLPDGRLFLSISPHKGPPGDGKVDPHLVQLGADGQSPSVHVRASWPNEPGLTLPTYRGITADAGNGELLAVSIAGPDYQASYMDWAGAWHPVTVPPFPIRTCYVSLALVDRAAHMLSIGDMIEPVPEWYAFKQKTQSAGFTFRRLFYTYTPNVLAEPFAQPTEIDSAEQTAGDIRHLDLYVDARGRAHLLYLKHDYSDGALVQQFLSGQSSTCQLIHVIVDQGEVVSRRVILDGSQSVRVGTSEGAPSCHYARLVVREDGRIRALICATIGGRTLMLLASLGDTQPAEALEPIPMAHPMMAFFTSSPRSGSAPSNIVDLLGLSANASELRYARIRLP